MERPGGRAGGEQERRDRGRLRRVAWLVALLALVALAWRVADGLGRPTGVFPSYWVAARLVLAGEPIARFYDDRWFARQVAERVPGVHEIYHANPPTTALLCLPLAPLPHDAAKGIMVALSALALLLSLGIVHRARPVPAAWRPWLAAFVLLAPAVRSNLVHGQVYLLVLLLFVLAWRCRRREPGVAGSALGLAAVAKMAGLPLWLLAAIERRWRALATAGIVAAAGLAAASAVAGPGVWTAWRGRIAELARDPRLSIPVYENLHAWALRLLAPHPRFNPDPLVNAPALAQPLVAVLVAGLLAVSLLAARATADGDLRFSLFLLLSLLASPVTGQDTLAVALLPAALLTARLRRWRSPAGGVLAVGCLLTFGPGAGLLDRFADGAAALAAFPRLYGTLLLWGLACREALADDHSTPSDSRPSNERARGSSG